MTKSSPHWHSGLGGLRWRRTSRSASSASRGLPALPGCSPLPDPDPLRLALLSLRNPCLAFHTQIYTHTNASSRVEGTQGSQRGVRSDSLKARHCGAQGWHGSWARAQRSGRFVRLRGKRRMGEGAQGGHMKRGCAAGAQNSVMNLSKLSGVGLNRIIEAHAFRPTLGTRSAATLALRLRENKKGGGGTAACCRGKRKRARQARAQPGTPGCRRAASRGRLTCGRQTGRR